MDRVQAQEIEDIVDLFGSLRNEDQIAVLRTVSALMPLCRDGQTFTDAELLTLFRSSKSIH